MYDKKKLHAAALKIVKANKCIFMQEVIDLTGVSTSTFYQSFPAFSAESEAIKSELRKNRASMKAGLRAKWYDSENATVQIALYKLLSSPEEFTRLASQKIELQSDAEPADATGPNGGTFAYEDLTESTREEVNSALFLQAGVQRLDFSKLSDDALQELVSLQEAAQ